MGTTGNITLITFVAKYFVTVLVSLCKSSPCTMCGSARLDFTCDHLTPINNNVRTFYSD